MRGIEMRSYGNAGEKRQSAALSHHSADPGMSFDAGWCKWSASVYDGLRDVACRGELHARLLNWAPERGVLGPRATNTFFIGVDCCLV